jgi:ComF family protein
MNPTSEHKLYSLVEKIFLPLRDIIYPQVCFLCNTSLINGESKVCAYCWKSFTPLTLSHPSLVEHKKQFQNDGYINDILSCYFFEQEGKLQEAIHLLKYQGMTSLGIRLGKDIGTKILDNEQFSEADYLIPVPLHKAKLRERGYNQSEFICKGISAVTKIQIASAFIKRTRHTQTQTHLSSEERKQNVSNAFMIEKKHGNSLDGATVILVDDVITTGSTMNECAKILRECGVREVFAASAALA